MDALTNVRSDEKLGCPILATSTSGSAAALGVLCNALADDHCNLMQPAMAAAKPGLFSKSNAAAFERYTSFTRDVSYTMYHQCGQ